MPMPRTLAKLNGGSRHLGEYEPYSLRKKRAASAGVPAVFSYHPIPQEMRAQAYYALIDAIGSKFTKHGSYNSDWESLEEATRKEHGQIRLPGSTTSAHDRLLAYLTDHCDTEHALDVFEMGFRQAQLHALAYRSPLAIEQQLAPVEAAVSLLNRRFRQHGLGYQFVGLPGVIVREDSQYIHTEVVEPAIALLHAAGFQGPLAEFLKAHQEYRRGENKDAMNDALKAFESTMKAICATKGWGWQPTWTASQLVKAMIDNGLIPGATESYFNGVRTVLESGIPTLRNKQSGHGQGINVTAIPDHIAAFALHLTAANIVLLMSAYREAK